jgi:outer membrane protein insertion porin family
LNINELPKLTKVKFTGVKKNKIEDLIKENGLTPGKVVNENLLTTTKNYIENKYKKDNNNVARVIYNGDRILYIFATIY